MVLLMVSPWKGVIRFRILARVSMVAYRLDLQVEHSQIYITFNVSQLRKCISDDTAVVPLEDIQVDDHLNYIESSIAILNRKTRDLRNKRVELVKVQWQHRRGSKWK